MGQSVTLKCDNRNPASDQHLTMASVDHDYDLSKTMTKSFDFIPRPHLLLTERPIIYMDAGVTYQEHVYL